MSYPLDNSKNDILETLLDLSRKVNCLKEQTNNLILIKDKITSDFSSNNNFSSCTKQLIQCSNNSIIRSNTTESDELSKSDSLLRKFSDSDGNETPDELDTVPTYVNCKRINDSGNNVEVDVCDFINETRDVAFIMDHYEPFNRCHRNFKYHVNGWTSNRQSSQIFDNKSEYDNATDDFSLLEEHYLESLHEEILKSYITNSPCDYYLANNLSFAATLTNDLNLYTVCQQLNQFSCYDNLIFFSYNQQLNFNQLRQQINITPNTNPHGICFKQPMLNCTSENTLESFYSAYTLLETIEYRTACLQINLRHIFYYTDLLITALYLPTIFSTLKKVVQTKVKVYQHQTVHQRCSNLCDAKYNWGNYQSEFDRMFNKTTNQKTEQSITLDNIIDKQLSKTDILNYIKLTNLNHVESNLTKQHKDNYLRKSVNSSIFAKKQSIKHSLHLDNSLVAEINDFTTDKVNKLDRSMTMDSVPNNTVMESDLTTIHMFPREGTLERAMERTELAEAIVKHQSADYSPSRLGDRHSLRHQRNKSVKGPICPNVAPNNLQDLIKKYKRDENYSTRNRRSHSCKISSSGDKPNVSNDTISRQLIERFACLYSKSKQNYHPSNCNHWEIPDKQHYRRNTNSGSSMNIQHFLTNFNNEKSMIDFNTPTDYNTQISQIKLFRENILHACTKCDCVFPSGAELRFHCRRTHRW